MRFEPSGSFPELLSVWMVGCLPRGCFSITRTDPVCMLEPAPYASLAMSDIGSAPRWPLFWFCFVEVLIFSAWFFIRKPKGVGVPMFFMNCVVALGSLSIVFDWPDAVQRVFSVLMIGSVAPCAFLILYLYNRQGKYFLYGGRIPLRKLVALGVVGLFTFSGLSGSRVHPDFKYMIAVFVLVSGFILFRYRSDIAKRIKKRGNPRPGEAPAPTPAPSTRSNRRTKPPGGRRRRRPSRK